MSQAANPKLDEALEMLPTVPSKIIAVHLSYESRAAQRGRTPAAPSYFFKAISSLGGSGGDIVRAEEAKLLAFEGEIAVIMGEDSRWLTEDNAWDAVGWVTASNDFGIYDMRAPDKGSNVRSKGGDGYTPIGPKLLDARQVDPNNITVKTWVNDELVQDDSSAGMIFSLSQMVADLSQSFTLKRGDIILTGTPAGSSVVQPGDVVEVEIASGDLSSGRLVTNVVQGSGKFDPALGDTPKVDDKQRSEAWGTDDVPTPAPALSDDLRARLEALPVASVSQQLRKMGLNNVSIDGVKPMHPEAKLVGVAKTLRFVPNREDLFKSHGGGHNAQKQAFDTVNPGEVIVIEARGEAGSGTMGDILAIRAKARGAAGIVTDGGVRDYAATETVGIPIFTSGPHPAVLGRKHVPWEVGSAVACGGATVLPGDIIVGDSDGVVVIPASLAQEVVDAAEQAEKSDAFIVANVQDGEALDGLFPMNDEWKARYEEWLKNQ